MLKNNVLIKGETINRFKGIATTKFLIMPIPYAGKRLGPKPTFVTAPKNEIQSTIPRPVKKKLKIIQVKKSLKF